MCHRRSAAFVLALATGLAACGGDKGSDSNTTTGNPLSQLTSAVSQMEKMSKGMTATANRKPVPPVSFKVSSTTCPKAWKG